MGILYTHNANMMTAVGLDLDYTSLISGTEALSESE